MNKEGNEVEDEKEMMVKLWLDQTNNLDLDREP
jgi:hypothetical protein